MFFNELQLHLEFPQSSRRKAIYQTFVIEKQINKRIKINISLWNSTTLCFTRAKFSEYHQKYLQTSHGF